MLLVLAVGIVIRIVIVALVIVLAVVLVVVLMVACGWMGVISARDGSVGVTHNRVKRSLCHRRRIVRIRSGWRRLRRVSTISIRLLLLHARIVVVVLLLLLLRGVNIIGSSDGRGCHGRRGTAVKGQVVFVVKALQAVGVSSASARDHDECKGGTEDGNAADDTSNDDTGRVGIALRVSCMRRRS